MLGDLGGSGLPTTRKRRRPALSCEQCRRRKIKCDRTSPCSQCIQAKIPACTYTEHPSRPGGRPPTRSDSASADDSSARFSHDNAYQSPSQASRSQDPLNTYLPTPASSSITSSTTRSAYRSADFQETALASNSKPATPSAEYLLERVQALEQSLAEAKSPQSIPANGNSSRSTSIPHLRASLAKTRFFGHSYWMSYFTQFERVFSYQSSTGTFEKGSLGSNLTTLLQNCKNMARVVKAQRADQIEIKQFYKDYMPSREVADKLVHLYLRTFESAYRVLHIPSFQKEYDEFWLDPQGTDPGLVIKILLVLAIGSDFYQESSPDASTLRPLAVQWIYAAMSWLSAPYEKGRLNLNGLQVHCLLILARQINAVGGDLVWNSAGSLMRMAIQMGFHRDPKYFSKMSPFVAEIRRRLWASILEINIQSAVDSGMPLLVSFDDFDTEPPANINDDEIDEDMKTPPHSKPSSTFTQTSLQIILIKCLRLRSEITRVTNDFHVEPSYEEVLRLNKELTNVCNDYTAFIRSSQANPSVSDLKPTVFHYNYIDVSIRRFFLGLHRLYAMRARKDPRFYFSRKVCTDTAVAMTCPLPDDDFYALMYLARGVFREMPSHTAAVIGLELITQLEEEGPSASDPRRQASREPLHQAMRQIINTWEKRIAAGEDNVKGHLFTSAVMGQIDALEGGTSVEEGIYAAAKKSAGVTYELLKRRAEQQPRDETSQDLSKILMDPTAGIPDLEYDFSEMGDMNLATPENWLFPNWNELSW